MKKLVSSVAIISLLLGSLSGCGAKPAAAPAATPAPVAAAATVAPAATPAPAAATAATTKPDFVLKYWEPNPEGHPLTVLAHTWADMVKKDTNGKVEIDIYASSSLGDEPTAYQSLQMGGGTIDIARGNANSLTTFGVKKLNLFSLPYIFRDRANMWKVLNSQLGQDFLKEPQQAKLGMVGLFYMDDGSRCFFSRKPLNSLADIKGMKIRVQAAPLMMDTVSALGANPTPISFSELYSSLQTGAVDGAEQPLSGYTAGKYYEVAPYFIRDEHTNSPGIVLISEGVWNKLTPDEQKVLKEDGMKAEKINEDNASKTDEALLAELKKDGATVVDVKDKTPWADATKSVISKYSKGLDSEIKQIQDLQK